MDFAWKVLAYVKKAGKVKIVRIWMRMLGNVCQTVLDMADLIWNRNVANAIPVGREMIVLLECANWIVDLMDGKFSSYICEIT